MKKSVMCFVVLVLVIAFVSPAFAGKVELVQERQALIQKRAEVLEQINRRLYEIQGALKYIAEQEAITAAVEAELKIEPIVEEVVEPEIVEEVEIEDITEDEE